MENKPRRRNHQNNLTLYFYKTISTVLSFLRYALLFESIEYFVLVLRHKYLEINIIFFAGIDS
jgi:hypothetical protein